MARDPEANPVKKESKLSKIKESSFAEKKKASKRDSVHENVSNGMHTPSEEEERDVRVQDFTAYVAQRKGTRDFFKDGFLSLPDQYLRDYDYATHKDLKNKNKFRGIYPYEDNRVKLEPIPGEFRSDYINASWMQGYNSTNVFIASLGPRKPTVDDFWRMIWQEKITTIIMVTNLKEASKEKCVQYWPDGEAAEEHYGEVKVTLQREESWPEVTDRKLTIKKGGVPRMVTQHHYTIWPDHGVPSDPASLISFRRKSLKNVKPSEPVLVHCSAGVGRTGTFLALDYLIKQAEAEGVINVHACVEKLRHQRNYMVQTVEQYVFLHEALSEYVQVGQTTITTTQLPKTYEDMKKNPARLVSQYKFLEESAPEFKTYDAEAALSAENKSKNRFEDVLPLTVARVYLKSRVRGRNDYINAVKVHGFHETNLFSVTQFPLKNTVVDFWWMILDEECGTIVVLRTADQDTSPFLPAKNHSVAFLDKEAVCLSTTQYESFVCRDVAAGERDESKAYSNEEFLAQLKDEEQRSRVFEMTLDDGAECLTSSDVIDVYKEMKSWRQQSKESKGIAVVCFDGARYSGQFVACCNMFDMINSEQEVDVYHVTKYIRHRRPQFISSLEQYQWLHGAANEYLAITEIYMNA